MSDLAADLELTLPPVSPAPYLRVVGPAAGPLEIGLAEAEEHGEAGRFAEAIEAVRALDLSAAKPRQRVRALFAEARALMNVPRLDEAEALVRRAHSVVEGPGFTDVDRAEALFRTGCIDFKRAHLASAVSLFTLALELCNRERDPSERLRIEILRWRSQAYQLRRDLDAARVDAEGALELAELIGDARLQAHGYFQASLVAERQGDRLLARFYAEEARSRYYELGDRLQLGRVLNNLGGITFLLGDAAAAVGYLEQAFEIAVESDSQGDGAQALSSLAQVHLRSGAPGLAEDEARRALELLEDRTDFLDEIGNTQLVLGKALLALDRRAEADAALARAEATFERLGSPSHLAAAWVAQGDAARAAGACERAADLYRRAAEALQDFHF